MLNFNNTAATVAALEAWEKKFLEAVGTTVESKAKELCPVDTGRLRSSITHEVGANEVQIGTNVEYGAPVELGTANMSPQPYLVPGLQNSRGEIAGLAATVISL